MPPSIGCANTAKNQYRSCFFIIFHNNWHPADMSEKDYSIEGKLEFRIKAATTLGSRSWIALR